MKAFFRPLNELPVLMKAGAIVPLRDQEVLDNSIENPEKMELRIFPAEDGSFTLAEDPGDTARDLDENWAFTRFEWKKEGAFTISPAEGNCSVLPEKRSWKLCFYAAEKACIYGIRVYAGDAEIAVQKDYDEEREILSVEIPAVSIHDRVCVSFEKAPGSAYGRMQHCFRILERAQMSYDLKEEVWNALQKKGLSKETLASFRKLPVSVRLCLEELL